MPYRVATGVWALFIAMVSTRFKPKAPESLDFLIGLDKIGHFSAYLVLAWLVANATRKKYEKSFLVRSALIFVACATYGMVLELIQMNFFPDRLFEWLDQVANSCGAFAGLLIFLYFYPTLSKNRQ